MPPRATPAWSSHGAASIYPARINPFAGEGLFPVNCNGCHSRCSFPPYSHHYYNDPDTRNQHAPRLFVCFPDHHHHHHQHHLRRKRSRHDSSLDNSPCVPICFVVNVISVIVGPNKHSIDRVTSTPQLLTLPRHPLFNLQNPTRSTTSAISTQSLQQRGGSVLASPQRISQTEDISTLSREGWSCERFRNFSGGTTFNDLRFYDRNLLYYQRIHMRSRLSGEDSWIGCCEEATHRELWLDLSLGK